MTKAIISHTPLWESIDPIQIVSGPALQMGNLENWTDLRLSKYAGWLNSGSSLTIRVKVSQSGGIPDGVRAYVAALLDYRCHINQPVTKTVTIRWRAAVTNAVMQSDTMTVVYGQNEPWPKHILSIRAPYSPMTSVGAVEFQIDGSPTPLTIGAIWVGEILRLPDGVLRSWRMGFQDTGKMTVTRSLSGYSEPGRIARTIEMTIEGDWEQFFGGDVSFSSDVQTTLFRIGVSKHVLIIPRALQSAAPNSYDHQAIQRLAVFGHLVSPPSSTAAATASRQPSTQWSSSDPSVQPDLVDRQ